MGSNVTAIFLHCFGTAICLGQGGGSVTKLIQIADHTGRHVKADILLLVVELHHLWP